MASRFFTQFLLGVFLCLGITYFAFENLYLIPQQRRDRDEATKELTHDATFLAPASSPMLPTDQIAAFAKTRNLHVTLIDKNRQVLFDSLPSDATLFKRLDYVSADRTGQVINVSRLPDGLGQIVSVLQSHPSGYILISRTDLVDQQRLTQSKNFLLISLLLAGLAGLLYVISITRRLAERERRLSEAIRTIGEADPLEIMDPTDPLAPTFAQPGDKIRRLQAAAIDGQEQLYAVFDSMVEPVAVCSEEGVVRRANQAFQDTFHVKTPVGKGLLEIIRHPALSSIVGGKSALLTDDHEMDYAGRIYLVTRIPLIGRQIQVILFNDVTRVRKLESVRKDFVANASHELRTPLTAIYGYAETLLDTPPNSPMAKQFVQMIFDNAKRLTSIFHDLIALSQIESNKITILKTWITLADAVPGILRALEDKMKEKKITLVLQFDVPRIYFDRGAFERILTNFAENAITYSEQERVLRVTSESLTNGTVKFSVIDQGIGIDKKHFERIFERFYCVDPSHSKIVGGTGLGLAIVKHLVELNGGTIEVTSELGKGSTFAVMIPQTMEIAA